MNFFTNKFSPKKTPSRKVCVSLANKDLSPKRIERELGPDICPIQLRLGDQVVTFENGLWIPETGKISATFKENEKLRKDLKKFEEENNLLKLKFELLLDMVSQAFVSLPTNNKTFDNSVAGAINSPGSRVSRATRESARKKIVL